MSKYTSITGKDVVLKFKGKDIIVPSSGYISLNMENLQELFPRHVKKYEEDIKIENKPEEVIIKKEIIKLIPEIILHEASSIIIRPLEIKSKIDKVNSFNIKDIELKIDKVNSFDIKDINFDIVKIEDNNVKDIIFKEVILEKTINNNIEEDDKEVDDFLNMIKKIIKE